MADILHIDTSKGPFFRGIGDAILLSWVVEGAKGSETELSLHASGTKRDVLEMLGVPLHPEPIGVSLSDVPVFDMEDGGAVKRTERIGQMLGIKTEAKRPTVQIPCWARHLAGQFWEGASGRRVLLCPEVSDHSREWHGWDQLSESLMERGHTVKTLTTDREKHYALAAAVLASADLVVAVDSSHAHMAATLGIPTIILLGPTKWTVFAHADNAVCISIPEAVQACVGCCFNYFKFSRGCRTFGCAALQLLPVESVLSVVRTALHDL